MRRTHGFGATSPDAELTLRGTTVPVGLPVIAVRAIVPVRFAASPVRTDSVARMDSVNRSTAKGHTAIATRTVTVVNPQLDMTSCIAQNEMLWPIDDSLIRFVQLGTNQVIHAMTDDRFPLGSNHSGLSCEAFPGRQIFNELSTKQNELDCRC